MDDLFDSINSSILLYIYMISSMMITWYRPIISSFSSDPQKYHLYIQYWVTLSLVLLIENLFFPVFSTNLGYYFLRTLFFYSLLERKTLKQLFSSFPVSENQILPKIGNLTDVKVLCSLLSNEEEIEVPANLHPWAPTPRSISILAICRLGELSSLSLLTPEDEEFIIKNHLSTIVELLDDGDDAISQNCMLALYFFSENQSFKQELMKKNLFEKLKRFVENKHKQVAETALRICRNIYSFEYNLQCDFINAGLGKRLVETLKERDPLSVLEGFENVFSLICVTNI